MNRLVGALLVAALAVGAQGCGLFEKKEEEKPKSEGNGGGGGGNGGGGGMDPLSFVNAPGNVMLCPDAKVGYMAEQTAESGGQKSVTSYAIVGESGDSFLVESVSPAITAMAGSFPDLPFLACRVLDSPLPRGSRSAVELAAQTLHARWLDLRKVSDDLGPRGAELVLRVEALACLRRSRR